VLVSIEVFPVNVLFLIDAVTWTVGGFGAKSCPILSTGPPVPPLPLMIVLSRPAPWIDTLCVITTPPVNVPGPSLILSPD
jgi:hypothetical protein